MKNLIIILCIFSIPIFYCCNSSENNTTNKKTNKDSAKLDSNAGAKKANKHAIIINLLEALDSTESRDYLIHEEDTADYGFLGESFSYLGIIGDYIITTHTYDWGNNSGHRTTRIMIFSKSGRYLGNYYTSGYLPTAIMSNGLYFAGFTVGDFSKSIPDSLIIPGCGVVNFEK